LIFSLTSLFARSLRLPFNTFRDQSVEALRKTDLEWTQIHNGFFLDYYGMPHIETYLTPLIFAVDIGNKTAAIPGTTGDETVTFTYTKDLGKFVVAALSLSKWDEAYHCYSENATLNQLIQAAEEATGEYQASANRKNLTVNREQVQHHV
jgi:nucleoside-diphosphate-sugar epimerase